MTENPSPMTPTFPVLPRGELRCPTCKKLFTTYRIQREGTIDLVFKCERCASKTKDMYVAFVIVAVTLEGKEDEKE